MLKNKLKILSESQNGEKATAKSRAETILNPICFDIQNLLRCMNARRKILKFFWRNAFLLIHTKGYFGVHEEKPTRHNLLYPRCVLFKLS